MIDLTLSSTDIGFSSMFWSKGNARRVLAQNQTKRRQPSPQVPRQDKPPMRRRARQGMPLVGSQVVDRLRPVAVQQPRKRPVGEELAAGLAAGAVVRLILGIDDALHRRAADRAGLAGAPVHGHAFAKGRDL